MSRPQACYIVGTDTEVGKTMITAGLLRALVGQGRLARALKPVQTGTILDEAVYARACPGAEVETLRHFQLAASPHLAAAREGCRLDLDRLADELGRAAARAEFTLIEGAGGVCTPLSPTETYLDLMVRRPFPVLLVIKNSLGAINHSLLSLAALRGAGLPAAGLILNQTTPPAAGQQLILDDNAAIISDLSQTPVLARIPYLDASGPGQLRPAEWAELAEHLRPAAEHLLHMNQQF